jgi:hypothetical protein
MAAPLKPAEDIERAAELVRRIREIDAELTGRMDARGLSTTPSAAAYIDALRLCFTDDAGALEFVTRTLVGFRDGFCDELAGLGIAPPAAKKWQRSPPSYEH